MQANRTELYHTTTIGYLKGKTPTGEEVVVHHTKRSASGYKLYWRGSWYSDVRRLRYYGFRVEETLGISPRKKKTGCQEGYDSQPNFMAVWQYFVERYNAGCEDVVFSTSPIFPLEKNRAINHIISD